jgi:cation diffusion facilitator CzcD-associated flavoprotein CzcO
MDEAAPPPAGLAALEQRLHQDLRWLELPWKPWVPPLRVQDREVTDVAIIGAGMCGLAAAAQLRLLGIDRLRIFDAAPEGREGPWVTYARMETLRSPKEQAGPALGLPALTFRAWFEAQFGAAAFVELGRAPRPMWMDYLRWFRRVMRVEVENDTRVGLIAPRGDGLLALSLGTTEPLLCRRVVLATGRDGLGGPAIPDFAARLPRHLWAHSSDTIDFALLRGKRVAVIGAGASAMDNAATALEAGCATLEMFVRRTALPAVDIHTGFAGMVHGYGALDANWKWRLSHLQAVVQNPPPRESVMRVSRHPNAHLHLASPILSAEANGQGLALGTPHGVMQVDFLILGTGFRVQPATRPELALLAPHIRAWRDSHLPAADEANEDLADQPDLAADFAFQERTPGGCPALRNVHCFNYAATLSHGKLTGDIRAVTPGVDRLARGIAASLFVEDAARHAGLLSTSGKQELRGDEWIRPPGSRGSRHQA